MTYNEEKLQEEEMRLRMASEGFVHDVLLFAEELKTADADERPKAVKFVADQLGMEIKYICNLQSDVEHRLDQIRKEIAEAKEAENGTREQ